MIFNKEAGNRFSSSFGQFCVVAEYNNVYCVPAENDDDAE